MEKRKKKRRGVTFKESISCWVILIILVILCIVPFIVAVSASLSAEQVVAKEGYSLFIKEFSLDTYRFLLSNKGKLLFDSFKITTVSTFLGTFTTVAVTTCFAWGVTQKREDFYFARPLSFIAWFTTVFGGGVLPWYILCTQYYGLKNNIFALFIPSCFNVWHMFILRGGFRAIPDEMIEAAKLDGASHSRTFMQIVIPMSRASIVVVAMFNLLGFWNGFGLSLWLTTDVKFQTMQKLLYNMLSSTTFLINNSEQSSAMSHMVPPAETSVMAVAIISIVPIILIYPFSLRYFVKGINLGGVKG